jgi:hypothetical protein
VEAVLNKPIRESLAAPAKLLSLTVGSWSSPKMVGMLGSESNAALEVGEGFLFAMETETDPVTVGLMLPELTVEGPSADRNGWTPTPTDFWPPDTNNFSCSDFLSFSVSSKLEPANRV